MKTLFRTFNRNRSFWITIIALLLIFILAVRGMIDTEAQGGERYQDVVITILRGFYRG